MGRIKYIVIIMAILLITSCGKSKNEINPLILGEWRLIEVYGVKADNSLGWFTIQVSPVQTIKLNSKGEYTLALDGNITCYGNFAFESNSSLRLNPNGCMPLMESVETIYKLIPDTLIISNHSNSISSYNDRRDKYIRND